MSNFICPDCGREILEGPGGWYVTECEHYPMSEHERERLKDGERKP